MKLNSVEKKEGSIVELAIEIEKEEFEKACDKAYHKNVGKITIPGFRKGKAPRKLIEQFYGPEVFFEDAIQICYPEAYASAVQEAGIDPVGQPSLTDFEDTDGAFRFKASVPVKPEVKVSDYLGLEAEKAEPQVTDEDIAQELGNMAERNARLVTVDRAIQNDDVIIFDFEGFIDGKPFEGGKAENYNLKIGSGMFIPGFEEQLVGKKAEEECEVSVNFPEEYQATELAGKPAVFKCKIHEVKESQKPELDDEFAKDVSEFDTLDELREDLKKKMQESRTARAESEYEEALMAKMLEKFEAEIPEVMFENQVDRIVEDFGYRMSMQGIDLDTYLKMNNMEMPAFRRLFREQAERQVRVRLALEKIAELEKMEVADEELQEEYRSLAEQNKLSEERVRELLAAEALKEDMVVQKALNLVKEKAVAVAPAPIAEEAKTEEAAPEKKPRRTKKSDSAEDKSEEKKPADKKSTKKASKDE